MNRWNYVHSNSVNLTDSSGHISCGILPNSEERADFVVKHVAPKNVDLLNTYTAAGIGVQCNGWSGGDEYSGKGIAQIADKQKGTEYGEKIETRDENGEVVVRGTGLRCFIRVADGCTECKTRDELTNELRPGENFGDVYKLEDPHDQTDPAWAVEYMKRRIQQVLAFCIDCTETDKFIAAALGQNGPGLNPIGMKDLSKAYAGNPYRPAKYLPINWELYFEKRIENAGFQGYWDTRVQLDYFFGVALELHRRSPTGWYIPSRLDTRRIKNLIKG